MGIPDLDTDITLGEHQSNETVTISLPKWKTALFHLSKALLGLLDKIDTNESYYDFEVKPSETEKIRMFFFAGVLDRSKYYLPVLTFILGLFILDTIYFYKINPQIYGLVLDMIGAIVIAFGLFRGTTGIERDTTTHFLGSTYGGRQWKDKKELSAVVRNTVDGVWGAFFLLFGFTVQIVAVSGIL
jgi:hypothetical protein